MVGKTEKRLSSFFKKMLIREVPFVGCFHGLFAVFSDQGWYSITFFNK
jgi:hypothetical protein